MKKFIVMFLFFGYSLCFGSILPDNDMFIPVDSKTASPVDEQKFNEILDEVERVYKPLFEKRGANLVIERKWTDGTVNAYAFQVGKDWHVAMFGGLARHNLMSVDGFMAVACHEIGHHLGGAPKGSWASNEGQSDYFSTSKCLRRIFSERKELVEQNAMNADDRIAYEKCRDVFKNEQESQLCFKSSVAGKALAAVLNSLNGGPTPLFGTPNKTVVTRTNNAHPQAQCRLDTYYAGAICDQPFEEDFGDTDAKVGACLDVGKRPACWYAK